MTETLGNSLNNPTATLSSPITSGSATLPVTAPAAPDGWPTAGQFRVLVGLELIIVTAATSSATSLAVVTRGAEGTTAAAAASGASVDIVATAAALIALLAAPPAIQSSGSLSTVSLSSGVASQVSATRAVVTFTPVTFNPGVATTATCTIAVSPDNVTFTNLGVETLPVGVALDGTIRVISVPLPVGWYIKLTVNAQATLGTTTYY